MRFLTARPSRVLPASQRICIRSFSLILDLLLTPRHPPHRGLCSPPVSSPSGLQVYGSDGEAAICLRRAKRAIYFVSQTEPGSQISSPPDSDSRQCKTISGSRLSRGWPSGWPLFLRAASPPVFSAPTVSILDPGPSSIWSYLLTGCMYALGRDRRNDL